MQQESKVILIIKDYCMPGMTGYEPLKKVKGSSFLKEVPVVIGERPVPTRIDKCLEEGAGIFMLKASQAIRREEAQMPLAQLQKLKNQTIFLDLSNRIQASHFGQASSDSNPEVIS